MALESIKFNYPLPDPLHQDFAFEISGVSVASSGGHSLVLADTGFLYRVGQTSPGGAARLILFPLSGRATARCTEPASGSVVAYDLEFLDGRLLSLTRGAASNTPVYPDHAPFGREALDLAKRGKFPEPITLMEDPGKGKFSKGLWLAFPCAKTLIPAIVFDESGANSGFWIDASNNDSQPYIGRDDDALGAMYDLQMRLEKAAGLPPGRLTVKV